MPTVPCRLPRSAGDHALAAYIPFDERGVALAAVEDGDALIYSEVALLASGGWLSTPSMTPVAVRFDLRDGALVCVVEDAPGLEATGWVSGRVEPCDDWVLVRGCRTAVLLDPSDGCTFSISVEHGERCSVNAAEMYGDRIGDPVTVIGAANHTTQIHLSIPEPELEPEPVPVPGAAPEPAPEPERVVLGVLVEPDGVTILNPIDQRDLRPGDVLVSVAGHDVGGLEDISRALDGATTGQQVLVRVERDGDVLEYWLYPRPPPPW